MTGIHYATEPNRLLLIWQSNGPVRTKFVVGELVRSNNSVSLSYFRLGQDFADAMSIGFVGHPAFRMDTPVHHHNVVEIFSKRIPPRNRSDFEVYLRKYGLENVPGISDFALLGYTGAYLPGDGFSFAIDFRFENLPYQFLMEISGFRYYLGMNIELSTLLNQFVTFEIEHDNSFDQNAVKINLFGVQIGYVPRYYAPIMRHWLQNCSVYGSIARIDGTLTKPQVYINMQVYSSSQGQIT